MNFEILIYVLNNILLSELMVDSISWILVTDIDGKLATVRCKNVKLLVWFSLFNISPDMQKCKGHSLLE